MSDWYCPKRFPIPPFELVTLRGKLHSGYEIEETARGVEVVFEVTEWQPEDPFNEPKPKGEKDE